MIIQAKPSPQKTTMSVLEMGKLLGLGRTDSFWLVKKGYFETIVAGGKTRIVINSFEKWYSSQIRYKKTDGPPPGQIFSPSMSIQELADELGLPLGTARYLVSRQYFKSSTVSGYIRIDRESFEDWYAHQFRYTKVDQTPNGAQLPKTMSAHEIGKMLNIPVRNTVYALTKKGVFKSNLIAGQLRIDIDSFEEWYQSQHHYKKIGDE
ncbi:MAG: helix-turn-helix domain-containing protein [Oscillospiraceae bacterium]|nr:helix-turn-helix domain-containing protein [Oscillospiraceae bacterium]